jgi:hypothetical protein
VTKPGPAVLASNDLDEDEIFVDEDGIIVAIDDWTMAFAVPSWYACQFISLLFSKGHQVMP